MKNHYGRQSVLTRIFTLSILGVLLAAGNGIPQNVKPITATLAKAYDMYAFTEFDNAIKSANELLVRSDLTSNDSIAIFEFLGVCTYAKGNEYHKQAFDYLNRIAAIGPCVNRLPQDFWPKQLCNHWYSVLKTKASLTCPDNKEGLQTIAFLPFDNYSVGEYQEKLGLLSHALAEFFAHDFSKVSALKVVERNKMDFLLEELKRTEAGITSESAAVRIGNMLGAQLMVFGTISQLDERNARMVAKVVNVETSEIIASVDKEGKPDFNRMQKELVKDLVRKLDVKLEDGTKDKLQQGGTNSFDALYYYSLGLDFMDQYDYKNAYENFKKAYDLDQNFTEAKQKMDTYSPLVG